jgi:hypothetical protein
MSGIKPPEDLQTLRKPILVVGRCPLVPGIGYDINGTLDRINGLPLQGYFREAFARNIDYIANRENGEVIIPPPPSDSDLINRLHGGIISLEPEITAPRNAKKLEMGNQQFAFYPQDCFFQLNGTFIVKDEFSKGYFNSLFPEESDIIVNPDIGEGGKTVKGQSFIFYSSKTVLPEKLVNEIKEKTHLTPIRIPSPKDVGIEDGSRAVEMDHIDQMIGPDIIVADRNGKYVVVPIAEDYYRTLDSKGLLPKEVQLDTQQDKNKVYYLPIKKRLLDMIDLLNCPTSKQRTYIGPILGQLASIFIENQEMMNGNTLESVDRFQDELIAKIEPFPARIDDRKEATVNTKLTYERLKFYETVLTKFNSWQAEAQSKLGIHTRNTHIMPNETPATHYFKAGTKCKLNIIS